MSSAPWKVPDGAEERRLAPPIHDPHVRLDGTLDGGGDLTDAIVAVRDAGLGDHEDRGALQQTNTLTLSASTTSRRLQRSASRDSGLA